MNQRFFSGFGNFAQIPQQFIPQPFTIGPTPTFTIGPIPTIVTYESTFVQPQIPLEMRKFSLQNQKMQLMQLKNQIAEYAKYISESLTEVDKQLSEIEKEESAKQSKGK